MRYFGGLFLLCLLVAGCVPGGTGSLPTETPLKASQLQGEIEKLPGARIREGNPVRIRYPAGVLFGDASVLPMPGGPDLLDPLVRLIRRSGLAWQLRVHAVSGKGAEYDSLLARERVKVLRAYLQASGVDLEKISIRVVPGPGVPLELNIAPLTEKK